MGILDEVRQSFGEDFFHPTTDREIYHNWADLCVCGHIDRYHSPSVGGSYELRAPKQVNRPDDPDRPVTESQTFFGCVGALRSRDSKMFTVVPDREARTSVTTINPTCPCLEFRPVAKVDRPNRFFNQRMPRPGSRGDRDRHPFMIGIRAFSTHLSKRTAAKKDPAWADREFDRRFVWLDGKRRCAISRCPVTEDVWPVLVDGELSELRCPRHRPGDRPTDRTHTP